METAGSEVGPKSNIPILPYSRIVGQEQLRLALELAYIAPGIGGVLISGHRGTGKSTAVRAFARMMYDDLPVTLPINATEDRVVGGWHIERLLDTELLAQPGGLDSAKQPGLLEQANGKLLFVDEVNLLDDHIVNIILDVTATGVLVIQREERSEQKPVRFTLVGTMNPEEGGLRPQLLDRFGLVVSVQAEIDDVRRAQILTTVMDFDYAKRQLDNGQKSKLIEDGRELDRRQNAKLRHAHDTLDGVQFSKAMAGACVKVARAFDVEGHRADYVMALSSRALAALDGVGEVESGHIKRVAPMALMHRRPEVRVRGREMWTADDDRRLAELLNDVR